MRSFSWLLISNFRAKGNLRQRQAIPWLFTDRFPRGPSRKDLKSDSSVSVLVMVRIRPFQLKDLPSIVGIHHSVMRDGMLWMFSKQVRLRYFRWLTSHDETRTWVGTTTSDQPVGYIIITKPSPRPPVLLTLQLFFSALQILVQRPKEWRRIVLQFLASRSPTNSECREIISFAIQGDSQSAEVGACLWKRSLEEEGREGKRVFVVSTSNPSLVNLYRRTLNAQMIEQSRFGLVHRSFIFSLNQDGRTRPKASDPS